MNHRALLLSDITMRIVLMAASGGHAQNKRLMIPGMKYAQLVDICGCAEEWKDVTLSQSLVFRRPGPPQQLTELSATKS